MDYSKIEIAITGILAATPEQINKAISQVAGHELELAADVVMADIMEATPAFTSDARKAWFRSPYEDQEGKISVTISNPQEYLLALDQGRIAKMPPVEPIHNWVVRKLGIDDTQIASKHKKAIGVAKPNSKAWQVAWAIAIKKSKVATPGTFFVENAVRIALPKASEILSGIVGAKLVDILAKSKFTGQ